MKKVFLSFIICSLCILNGFSQSVKAEILSTLEKEPVYRYDEAGETTQIKFEASKNGFSFVAASTKTKTTYKGTVVLENYTLIFKNGKNVLAKLEFCQPVEYARGAGIRFELITKEDNTKNNWFNAPKGWFLGHDNGTADIVKDDVICNQLNKNFYAKIDFPVYSNPNMTSKNLTTEIWSEGSENFVYAKSKNEFLINNKKGRWIYFRGTSNGWIFASDDELLSPEDFSDWQRTRKTAVKEEKIFIGNILKTSTHLRLRTEEAKSSTLITTMAQGTKVKILKIGKKDTVEGLNSYWVNVEILPGSSNREGKPIQNGTTGWCFGGYLQ